ncbi:von Willebrand factor A domain-containing protein 5B2 [Rhinophrynus dorsalis]
MPGLYNASSWVQLPLEASTVTACANGYSLGLSAHLTYLNPSNDTVQAVFIYLLEDGEVVTSFEATTDSRRVQAQVRSQIQVEDCCSKFSWEALPCLCRNGHLVLDADTARSLFVLSVGAVPPSTSLSVFLRSSKELKTLSNGAVRVTLNSTLTPLAPLPEGPSEQGQGLCDDSATSCFGGVSVTGVNPWVLLNDPLPQVLSPTPPSSLSTALTGPATNPHRYLFSFRLQVEGPCLLAGIESPSHALRADASPFALSASSVWISLAEDFQCDRALEIILHPSEPHLPHLSLERGTKSFSQYETQIRERRDFLRAIKKSRDPEKQVSFVRRRFHKDLHLNPVLMLNFCPDLAALSSLSSDLPTVTREVIFIVHQIEEVSRNVRDAILLAVRSLPALTLLNIGSGACNGKILFPTSRQCSNESLEVVCDYIRSGRLGGTASNLRSVLGHVLALPVHRGYPRQVFLLTDSVSSCPGRVIELVRRHAKTTRVFCFGLGTTVGNKLLEGVAGVSNGTVELLAEEERLQPKLIKSLKKALEPALSDITIDWYMPDTMEALLTPNDIAHLYPGNSLIGFCALYHTASFRSKKGMGRGARGGSFSSVFQSQEESQTPGTTDTSCLNRSTGVEDVGRALQEISHEISLEFSGWSEELEKSEEGASVSDIRRRIVQSSYVQDQYVLTHCSVSTEPTQAQAHPSTTSDPTHTLTHSSTSSESMGSRDAPFGDCPLSSSTTVSKQGRKSVSQSERISTRIKPSSYKAAQKCLYWGPLKIYSAGLRCCQISTGLSNSQLRRVGHRSFSSPQGELDMLRLRTVLDKVSQSREPELDKSCTREDNLVDSCHLSPSQLDWDMLIDAQYLFSASPAAEGGSTVSRGSSDSVWQCRAVIRGLIGGRSLSWETSVSLEPLLSKTDEDTTGCCSEDSDCDLHHLAARTIIQDNEDMAWRLWDIEHGSSRRYRLKAIQTSKSCCQVSSFTCHVPVEPTSQDVLSEHIIMRRGGRSKKFHNSSSGNWFHGDNRCSEIMDETFMTADEFAALPSSPLSLSSESSERQPNQEGHNFSSFGSQKSSDTSLSSRIIQGKRKIRSISGKLPPLKPPCLSGDKERNQEFGLQDYLPLVTLQSSEGFFSLNNVFSSVVQISLQRLLRASPYSSHRGSLSPVSEPCPLEQGHLLKGVQTYKGGSHPQVPRPQDPTFVPEHALSCPEALCQQADSGRGSETDPCETSPCPSEVGTDMDTDLEGCSWATAVALAWLEHCSAGFFTEWELLAARAEGWLRAQILPDGLHLPALKGAARQLFLLLRHWDENLNLNMLCYKPGDV